MKLVIGTWFSLCMVLCAYGLASAEVLSVSACGGSQLGVKKLSQADMVNVVALGDQLGSLSLKEVGGDQIIEGVATDDGVKFSGVNPGNYELCGANFTMVKSVKFEEVEGIALTNVGIVSAGSAAVVGTALALSGGSNSSDSSDNELTITRPDNSVSETFAESNDGSTDEQGATSSVKPVSDSGSNTGVEDLHPCNKNFRVSNPCAVGSDENVPTIPQAVLSAFE